MPNSHSALYAPADIHEGKRLKQPVRAASTATVTLASPGATMDDVTLSNGDRVLLKDQSSASQNGIYTWTGAGATLTRTPDSIAAADFVFGFLTYVREGTANGATYWTFTTSAAVTLGSTSLAFTKVGVTAGSVIDPTTTRGDLLTRGVSAVVRLALGATGSFLGSNGTDPAWTNTAAYYATSGLTGATAAVRFVGGTVSGAPASGTFAVGDFVIDQTGKVFVCTVSGTPGTWTQSGSTATTYAPTGLTGATAYSRYAGATVSGAPVSGTFAVGDWIVDQVGKQWICTGAGSPGTWTQSSGGMSNPMTTNQDIIVATTSGVPARVAVGANGQVLSIVAGVVSWAASAAGFSNPMTQIGDLIVGITSGAADRLGIGANGQVLTVIGGQPGWADPTGGGGGGSTNNVTSALYLNSHVS